MWKLLFFWCLQVGCKKRILIWKGFIIKTRQRRYWYHSGVFTNDCKQILLFTLVSLLRTVNMPLPGGTLGWCFERFLHIEFISNFSVKSVVRHCVIRLQKHVIWKPIKSKNHSNVVYVAKNSVVATVIKNTCEHIMPRKCFDVSFVVVSLITRIVIIAM